MTAKENNLRYYGRIAGTLFAITAVVALVLAVVNLVTAPIIEQRTREKRETAMTAVVPGADVFSQMYFENPDVDDIQGAYAATTLKGYCVEVTTHGFGGPITLMVGVSPTGTVTGVVILSHSETPSLGAEADKPGFLSQFVGRSGTINVKSGGNAVNAVSGATVTSKAVTAGVNLALAAIADLDREGGVPDEGTV